ARRHRHRPRRRCPRGAGRAGPGRRRLRRRPRTPRARGRGEVRGLVERAHHDRRAPAGRGRRVTAMHVATGEFFEVRIAVPDAGQYDAVLHRLVADKVASRLVAHDATLWGPAAEEEAAKRLGWTDLHLRAGTLVEEILALR